MHKFIKIWIFLGLFSVFSLHGQGVKKLYSKAEKLFYDEQFDEARIIYEQIVASDPAFRAAIYKREICILLTDRLYSDLSKFNAFEDEMKYKDKFYYYWKGRVMLGQYRLEEAMVYLRRFLTSPAPKSQIIIKEAYKWVKWCQRAKVFMDNPGYYEIHRLEAGVNTKQAELSPVFFAGHEELLFVSNRDETKKDQYEIYHTRHEGDQKWSEPSIVEGIGTFSRDQANIEVVAEDGRLFHFREDKGGSLYYSEPSESKMGWSMPVVFDSKVASAHLHSHFFINEHEDRILFAKNVGGKKGKNLDLFQTYKDAETGDWSNPAPFAPTINSPYDEDSPYLSPDETELYFSSNGHHTMGGYDVFRSTFDKETLTWSAPKNLGFPVNSPDDELHFKLNPDQISGYFSSNRLNTIGDFDIFFFWEIHKVNIQGRVIDNKTGEPVTRGRIFFRPLAYPQLYYFSPIDEEGQYNTVLSADEAFTVEIKKENGEIISLDQFEIHVTGGTQTTYLKDFYLFENE